MHRRPTRKPAISRKMRSRHNNIPFADPALRFSKFREQINQTIHNLVGNGPYILSEHVADFEKDFSDFTGTSHCIAVNSGTDALTLALMAYGIGAGDEVIVPGLTAPATVVAVLRAGATPVVVDIAGPTLTISVDAMKKVINSRTKAVIPVHLHGYVVNSGIFELAKKHKLTIFEDCAQAHGATYEGQHTGTFGDCGAFSFYPTKNLGCMGDGGAIVTNDDAIASKIRQLRHYGMDSSGIIYRQGINSRLDELQAATLSVLLPHLNFYNEQRIAYAHAYYNHLQDHHALLPPLTEGAVYHQFALRLQQRDALKYALERHHVETAIHYTYTIADHPALKHYCQALPHAQQAANTLISLPIQPEVLDDHFDVVVTTLQQLLPAYS